MFKTKYKLCIIFVFVFVSMLFCETSNANENYSFTRVEMTPKEAQTALKNAGYYHGKINGKLRGESRDAIIEFQYDNSLAVNGFLNSQTKRVLLGYLDKKKRKKKEKKKKSRASSVSKDSKYEKQLPLKKREIQTALKISGYYQGRVDGKIGKKTEFAIRKFQIDNGLKVDGIAGHKTQEQLLVYLNQSTGDKTIHDAKEDINVSMSNKEIQTALTLSGCYRGKIDGKIGKKSTEAIKKFQKKSKLKGDGIPGPKTRKALIKYLNS